MSEIFRQPKMNPFRFAKADFVMNSKHGYPAFGTALHKDSLKPDHVQDDYYHKVTPTQPICIQYHRGKVDTYDPTELYIQDRNGNLLKFINPTSTYTHPGKKDAKTGEQLYTEQFHFTLSQFAELNGHDELQFLLRIYYSNEASPLGFIVEDYRCDRLLVADEWPEHCYVEYSHPVNEPLYDVLFEELRPRFTKFIPSKGMFERQGGVFTVYTNQVQNSIRLYGANTDDCVFDMGGKEGLPMYEIDVLDDALSVKNVRIDGRLYTRLEKEFEIVGSNDKHREFRRCKMQHAEDILTFRRGLVQVWKQPGTYPYAIGRHVLADGFIYQGFLGAKMFNDSAAEDDYIDALNTYSAGMGYTGEWLILGGWVCWSNGQNESFDLVWEVKVFPRMQEFTVNVAAALQAFTYSLGYNTNTVEQHVAVWGSISGTEEIINSTYTSFGSGGFTNVASVRKVFGSTGNKTVRIFTDDKVTEFNCARRFPQPAAPEPKITNFNTSVSSVSSILASYRLFGHDMVSMSSLSLSFLANSKNTLKFLTIERCNVNAIPTGWAQALISGAYKPFRLLEHVELSKNKLSVASVDGVFNEIHQHTNWSPGFKYINVSGNSPTAAPTGASSAARNPASTTSLAFNGYQLIHD